DRHERHTPIVAAGISVSIFAAHPHRVAGSVKDRAAAALYLCHHAGRMREMANIETVRTMVAAFRRGDIASMMERLDETVVWITPGSAAVPLSGRRRGVDEVRAFFEQLVERLTFTVFEVREFLAQGNRVVALVHYEGRNQATGREF